MATKSRDSGVTDQLSKSLLEDILLGNRQPGARLNALQISQQYKVSRTPVREALLNLEKQHIVERRPNKGFYVVDSLPEGSKKWAQERLSKTVDEYQRVANDWLADAIPEEVTEFFLRERYGWTKSKTIEIMSRAAREGWVERKPGYGWRLLPVVKTAEAFCDVYRFRMAIEPAALLEHSFDLNFEKIESMIQTQQRMRDATLAEVSDEIIVTSGPSFHEELISLSGNSYFVFALQHANKMRRLMEYKAKVDLTRLSESCVEHIDILEMILAGKREDASMCLREHLADTLERKVAETQDWFKKKSK
ncbi:MAG: GntR family transcriptional regulator [Pontibacterium sp.]